MFLDECVDRRLARHLPGHDVSTAHSRRWTGLPDALLLQRCLGEIDVFVTVDANPRYQQDLSRLDFGIVVLRSPESGLAGLVLAAPALLAAIAEVGPGRVLEVNPPR